MKLWKLLIISCLIVILLTGCASSLDSTRTPKEISSSIQKNTDEETTSEYIPTNKQKKVYEDNTVLEEKYSEGISPSLRKIKIRNAKESRKKQAKKTIRKRIGNLKPINRIIVGNDFIIDTIKENENLDINDPGAKSQWAITDTNTSPLWDQIEQKRTINVAVVDTGVDYNHLDLANRIQVDRGYDFVNDDIDPMDDNGHGTHVAGIIAAEMNNGEGITGIVGDVDVKIIPIKVLDEHGQGDTIIVAEGILYAVDQGADIINLSLGGSEQDEHIISAIRYAQEQGVFVVAAAGNEHTDCDHYIPAGMDGVYTVAASNLLHRSSRFSNYGTSIDITAPGIKILSTVPGGGYEAWDGTSMAAPIVTGIAAMLLAEEPNLPPQEMTDILNASATDILSLGEDNYSGYGLINAEEAYHLLRN